jgi:hypothetical protein
MNKEIYNYKKLIDYCANQLGTNNYYFTDNVCTYQQGVGCVGNPLAGK